MIRKGTALMALDRNVRTASAAATAASALSVGAASLWFAYSFDKRASQAITAFNKHAHRASTNFELACNAFHHDIRTVSALSDDQVAFLGRKVDEQVAYLDEKVDELLDSFRTDSSSPMRRWPRLKQKPEVRVPVKQHFFPIFRVEDRAAP